MIEQITLHHAVLPDFLLEMSRQMHQQDNRCTRDPIWVVCHDEKLTCADGCGDYWVLVDRENNADIEELFDSVNFNALPLVEHVREYYPQHFAQWLSDNQEDWPEDSASIAESLDDPHLWLSELGIADHQIGKFDVQTVTREVKYCLTESDANAFIARKQHDYPKLYTFVKSMVFCPQMVELREWILSLTTPPAEGNE
ncbi:ead/Ea22-like family protein [Vibrio fluvialis]|uniref:ead/Ea22-like family protein n=1 Tax=Vibrio fluvialis TaxID=676 RepID=UPI001EECF2E5|nr:ead/Ea22-like family protein [Vibrio fluvialis]MCG6387537.1 ead/Ea22-like family protein [Vibrio fluvialis]MCG6418856.1 ead/Ea22-like family protein [Vibrio fluvialis]